MPKLFDVSFMYLNNLVLFSRTKTRAQVFQLIEDADSGLVIYDEIILTRV